MNQARNLHFGQPVKGNEQVNLATPQRMMQRGALNRKSEYD